MKLRQMKASDSAVNLKHVMSSKFLINIHLAGLEICLCLGNTELSHESGQL